MTYFGIPRWSFMAKELMFSLPNYQVDYYKLNSGVICSQVGPDLKFIFCQPCRSVSTSGSVSIFYKLFWLVSWKFFAASSNLALLFFSLWQFRLHPVVWVSDFALWSLILSLRWLPAHWLLFWDHQMFLHWLIKPGLKVGLLHTPFEAHTWIKV